MIDIVPNHMGVDDPHNRWWQDVLANGPGSAFAKYFDIDWNPPKEALRGKVLLPVLGDQFGKVLEDRSCNLPMKTNDSCFGTASVPFPPIREPGWRSSAGSSIWWPIGWRLTSRSEWNWKASSRPLSICRRARQSATRSCSSDLAKSKLPGDAWRDCWKAATRCGVPSIARLSITTAVAGDPTSFDRLEAFVTDQPYRLCHWRVATDEINYRRFFDVDSLAAMRVEEPEVFHAMHAADSPPHRARLGHGPADRSCGRLA